MMPTLLKCKEQGAVLSAKFDHGSRGYVEPEMYGSRSRRANVTEHVESGDGNSQTLGIQGIDVLALYKSERGSGNAFKNSSTAGGGNAGYLYFDSPYRQSSPSGSIDGKRIIASSHDAQFHPDSSEQIISRTNKANGGSESAPVLSYGDKALTRAQAGDRPVSIHQIGDSHVAEAGKVYEFKLDHNTGRHKVDASVIVPRDYDPDKPTRMLIYNHGFGTDAHAALNYSKLPDQMKSADPQTILVVPEWQASPGSRSAAQGRSDQQGFYKGMLNEIMQKTPQLRGKTVDDIASLGIIAHSAGYSPAMAQLYNNGLANKISSVTVLDSMYKPQAYDRWISNNLRDIAAGNKQFQLIYTGHLSNQSRALESRVEQQLIRAGLGTKSLYKEHGRGGEIVSPETMAQYGFVFKRSEFTTRGDGAHGAMTNVYLRQLLNSERLRRR